MSKVETVKEFLARGGAIKVIPSQEKQEVSHVMHSHLCADPHLMDLEEGSFYFSEAVEKAKGKKYNSSNEKLNLSILPPDLVRDLKLNED